MDGKGGGGVRVTGQGWFRYVGDGPEVWSEVSGLERGDAKSSRSEVGEGDGAKYGGNLAGLVVKVKWGVCRFVSTLIATL